MNDSNQIRSAIFSALEELNQISPADQRIAIQDDARLTGAGGKLDSLGFVNLIVLVEEKIEQQVGASLSLLDDDLADGDSSRFDTVRSLTAYVSGLLAKRTNV